MKRKKNKARKNENIVEFAHELAGEDDQRAVKRMKMQINGHLKRDSMYSEILLGKI